VDNVHFLSTSYLQLLNYPGHQKGFSMQYKQVFDTLRDIRSQLNTIDELFHKISNKADDSTQTAINDTSKTFTELRQKLWIVDKTFQIQRNTTLSSKKN